MLAPVLCGRRIAVRIAGIVCHLRVDDPHFEGWAVVQPQGGDRARIACTARPGDVTAYPRQSLDDEVSPSKLAKKGLSVEERAAYA